MLLFNVNIKDIDRVLENARASLYTYIFISFELANTLSFYNLLKDPKFKKQLALVVVNKAYFII